MRSKAVVPPSQPPRPETVTIRRLLEAAGEIFAEKGFKGATVREITSRADANIALVNYHFGDKERLYIEAVKQVACSSQETLEWPADTPPADKLRDFIRFHVHHLLDPNKPAWHMRLMMRELAAPSAACTELVSEFIEPKSRILGSILRELLGANTPRRQIFLTAFSIIGQCLFHVTHKPIVKLLVGEREYPSFDADTLAEHITRFSLRALGVAEK